MLKIAIVDDSAEDAQNLTDLCNRYAQEKDLEFNIKTFYDGLNFITSGNLDFDIIMLDIKMPYMNGLQAARKIRESNQTVVIVFVTNMQQYAIRGYEVEATDFLIKPLSYNVFKVKFDRILSLAVRHQEQSVPIKINRSIHLIKLSDLFLVESDKHKLIYHTASGDYETWGTMKEVCDSLEGRGFALCNSSCLVNLRYVDSLDSNNVYVKDVAYPISRLKRKSFLAALTLV